MNTPPLSKPLQVLLLATAVLVMIALLKPDASDAPIADGGPAKSATEPDAPSAAAASAEPPWVRSPGEEWMPSPPQQARALADAAAPQAAIPPQPEALPPPKPSAPDPGLTYLGRMDEAGRSHVFLGRGAEPQVVEIGGLVDAQWKVEKATATQIELRYLPLNEVRVIPVQ